MVGHTPCYTELILNVLVVGCTDIEIQVHRNISTNGRRPSSSELERIQRGQVLYVRLFNRVMQKALDGGNEPWEAFENTKLTRGTTQNPAG